MKSKVSEYQILPRTFSMILGYFDRHRYHKLRFLNLMTGKKAHEISEQELRRVPMSKPWQIKLTEDQIGKVTLNKYYRQLIAQNR